MTKQNHRAALQKAARITPAEPGNPETAILPGENPGAPPAATSKKPMVDSNAAFADDRRREIDRARHRRRTRAEREGRSESQTPETLNLSLPGFSASIPLASIASPLREISHRAECLERARRLEIVIEEMRRCTGEEDALDPLDAMMRLKDYFTDRQFALLRECVGFKPKCD